MKFFYQQRIFQIISLHQDIFPKEFSTDEMYSFVWISEGTLDVEIDNIKYKIESPSILSISPNQKLTIYHSYKKQYLLQYNKQFYGTLRGDKEVSMSALLFHNMCTNRPLKVSQHLKERLQRFINLLYEEMEKQEELKEEMIRILLKGFIIITTRLAQQQIFEKVAFSKSQISLFQDFIFLVDKHFKQHHQVKFYAEQLHKAPKSLSNQFALLNLPKPINVIHERILLEAKHLLLNTSLSFSEIAFILGFEELSQFSRFFKKNLGITPSSFRKEKL